MIIQNLLHQPAGVVKEVLNDHRFKLAPTLECPALGFNPHPTSKDTAAWPVMQVLAPTQIPDTSLA
jgi:hypothetical protein